MNCSVIGAVAFIVVSSLAIPARAEALFQETQSGVEFSQFPRWGRVLADTPAPEAAVQRVSDGCADERRCTPPEWTAFLDGLKDQPRAEQIAAVNHWVNQRPYVEDMANWGMADYWQTPGEFLAHGGDCEDFAITKYFSLRRLGVPDGDLRLVVVEDPRLKAFHAVLTVREGGEVLLLDNQSAEVTAFAAADYTPVYSLNGQGWWIESLPKIGLGAITIVAAGPASR
jgi:predicted transglutaminase-like cysteine proteinase